MAKTQDNVYGYNFSAAEIHLIKTILSLPHDHLQYCKLFEVIYGQNMMGNMGIFKDAMENVKKTIANKEFDDLLTSEMEKLPDAAGTSYESYEETKATNMGEVQQLIYSCITSSEFPLSRTDVANRLNLRIQTVTARVRELVKAGSIKVEGTKIDKDSGRKVSLLVAKLYNK